MRNTQATCTSYYDFCGAAFPERGKADGRVVERPPVLTMARGTATCERQMTPRPPDEQSKFCSGIEIRTEIG